MLIPRCLAASNRPPRTAGRALSIVPAVAVFVMTVMVTDATRASVVYFPVTSGGTISQPGVGQSPTLVAFGNINLGAGTFTVSTDFGSGTSFGIGFNPTDAPFAEQFFTQSNNNIAWLVPGGTVSLLAAGATVGSGSYSSSDPFFATSWRSGVAPGYAGLRLTSGSDVYYGWASLDYVVGSPDQVTVTSFAFENQANTPVVIAGVPEIDPAGFGSVAALIAGGLGLIERRRSRAKAIPRIAG